MAKRWHVQSWTLLLGMRWWGEMAKRWHAQSGTLVSGVGMWGDMAKRWHAQYGTLVLGLGWWGTICGWCWGMRHQHAWLIRTHSITRVGILHSACVNVFHPPYGTRV